MFRIFNGDSPAMRIAIQNINITPCVIAMPSDFANLCSNGMRNEATPRISKATLIRATSVNSRATFLESRT